MIRNIFIYKLWPDVIAALRKNLSVCATISVFASVNGNMFVRIVDAYQVGCADFLGLGVDK